MIKSLLILIFLTACTVKVSTYTLVIKNVPWEGEKKDTYKVPVLNQSLQKPTVSEECFNGPWTSMTSRPPSESDFMRRVCGRSSMLINPRHEWTGWLVPYIWGKQCSTIYANCQKEEGFNE